MKADTFNAVANSNQGLLTPRTPSLSERAELLSLLLDSETSDQFGIAQEEVINAFALITSAFIAVYDNYATDSRSGYTGELMAVVVRALDDPETALIAPGAMESPEPSDQTIHWLLDLPASRVLLQT